MTIVGLGGMMVLAIVEGDEGGFVGVTDNISCDGRAGTGGALSVFPRRSSSILAIVL
jgi:hypothetical protein